MPQKKKHFSYKVDSYLRDKFLTNRSRQRREICGEGCIRFINHAKFFCICSLSMLQVLAPWMLCVSEVIAILLIYFLGTSRSLMIHETPQTYHFSYWHSLEDVVGMACGRAVLLSAAYAAGVQHMHRPYLYASYLLAAVVFPYVLIKMILFRYGQDSVAAAAIFIIINLYCWLHILAARRTVESVRRSYQLGLGTGTWTRDDECGLLPGDTPPSSTTAGWSLLRRGLDEDASGKPNTSNHGSWPSWLPVNAWSSAGSTSAAAASWVTPALTGGNAGANGVVAGSGGAASEDVPAETLADVNSKFLQVAGLKVHYKECFPAGMTSSDPAACTAVVLMHGFGAGVFAWRHVMQTLADQCRCRVVAFDRPAFGLTERPPVTPGRSNPYTLAYQSCLLLALCKTLGITRVMLAGHSDGCLLALKAASMALGPKPVDEGVDSHSNHSASHSQYQQLSTIDHDTNGQGSDGITSAPSQLGNIHRNNTFEMGDNNGSSNNNSSRSQTPWLSHHASRATSDADVVFPAPPVSLTAPHSRRATTELKALGLTTLTTNNTQNSSQVENASHSVSYGPEVPLHGIAPAHTTLQVHSGVSPLGISTGIDIPSVVTKPPSGRTKAPSNALNAINGQGNIASSMSRSATHASQSSGQVASSSTGASLVSPLADDDRDSFDTMRVFPSPDGAGNAYSGLSFAAEEAQYLPNNNIHNSEKDTALLSLPHPQNEAQAGPVNNMTLPLSQQVSDVANLVSGPSYQINNSNSQMNAFSARPGSSAAVLTGASQSQSQASVLLSTTDAVVLRPKVNVTGTTTASVSSSRAAGQRPRHRRAQSTPAPEDLPYKDASCCDTVLFGSSPLQRHQAELEEALLQATVQALSAGQLHTSNSQLDTQHQQQQQRQNSEVLMEVAEAEAVLVTGPWPTVVGLMLLHPNLTGLQGPALSRLLAGSRLGRTILRPLLRSELGEVVNRRAWHDSTKLTQEVLDLYKAPLRVIGWCESLIEITRLRRDQALGSPATYLEHARVLPALLLTGEHDKIVPPPKIELLSADLPFSRLAVINGCGHLSHEEAPGQLLQQIIPWADKVLKTSAAEQHHKHQAAHAEDAPHQQQQQHVGVNGAVGGDVGVAVGGP